MKTKNPESESLWTKAPVANLVRYEPSGIYFARVAGAFERCAGRGHLAERVRRQHGGMAWT